MTHRILLALILGLLTLPALPGQDLASLKVTYESAKGRERLTALNQIARLKSDDSRAWLRTSFEKTEDEGERVSLLGALGTDGHRSNGPFLLKIIQSDPPYRIAYASVNALGRLEGDWLPTLRRIAENTENSSIRYAAVNALANTKSDEAFDLLVQLMRGEDPLLQRAALTALGRVWPLERVRPLLDEVLAKGDPPAVSQVVGMLLDAKSPEALQVIRARLGDSTLRGYSGQWIEGLAAYDSVTALELMAALVAEGAPRAAGSLDRGLRMMKAPEVLSWLRDKGLRAENEDVAAACRRRLLATGAPEDESMALKLALGPDDGLAVEAIDALADFPGARVRKVLEKLVGHRDPQRSAAALASLWTQSEKAQDVRKDVTRVAQRSKSWQLRLIATELLAQVAAEHEDLLVKKFRDRHPLVRAAAYDALTHIRERRIVTLLIDQIGKEKSTRASTALASALYDLTDFDFGLREKRWKDWWKMVGDEYPIPPKPEKKKTSSTGGGGRYSHYYGIEVRSNRVAFVIDVSGSMGSAGTGVSKLQIAKDNLIGVLDSFSKQTHFNIIAFHSVVVPWEDRLVPAGPSGKGEAKKWVMALQATGGTNIYDSLMRAMDLEGVDTIFLLSDGGPSAGEVTDTDEILRRVSRINRLRRIRINTVGIGLGGVAKEFMEKLAEQNYGESVTR